MAKRVLVGLVLLVCLRTTGNAQIDYQSGTIRGTVTNSLGVVPPMMIVRVTPASTASWSTLTAYADSTGTYEIDFVPVGDYRLDVMYENALVASAPASVLQGQITTQNFTWSAAYVSAHVTRNGIDDANAPMFVQSADPAPGCYAPGATCTGDTTMCSCDLGGRHYWCDPSGACHWDMTWFFQAQSDTTGVAKKLVPAGTYNILVGSSSPPMPPPDPMNPTPTMGMTQSGYIQVGTAMGIAIGDRADVSAGTFPYDTATVTGTVTAGGEPLANVTIRAQTSGLGEIDAWVDATGAYSMQLPTLATYVISALQDGNSVIKTYSGIALTPGETYPLDFAVPGANLTGSVTQDGIGAVSAPIFLQLRAPSSCSAADSCDAYDPLMGWCHCTVGGQRFSCYPDGTGGSRCFWDNGGFSSTFTDSTGAFKKFLSPGTYDFTVGSAPVQGGMMGPLQWGSVLVGTGSATIVDGVAPPPSSFAYTTGTVSGQATSCGGPLKGVSFELRPTTAANGPGINAESWDGSYSLRAPVGDYTLGARFNNAPFGQTPITISSTAATWSANLDLGQVRGLILRDGQPSINSMIYLQEVPPTTLTCKSSCQFWDTNMDYCMNCPANSGRLYMCDHVNGCRWLDARFYQASTGTDGYFTTTVVPGSYKLAVFSGSTSPMPGDPMGGGQSGGILIGTFDLAAAACVLTEFGVSAPVGVPGVTSSDPPATVSLGDGIQLTFTDVAAGSASFTATSTPPPNQPDPIFKSAGLFYDIVVPTIGGPVTVCLPYDAESVGPDTDLHLYHNDPNTGWTDITTSVDTVNHIVCGVTPSFSWFAVGIATAPPPPPLVAQGPAEVSADSSCHGHATLSVSGGTGTYEWFLGDNSLGGGSTITATLPLGASTVRVADGSGSVTVSVNVVDTTGPTFSVAASPSTLWPPNGTMVSIAPVASVTDNCDPSPKVVALSATGSAGTPADIVVGSGGVSLRAFRAGNETAGRTYTIQYSATDASGNRSTASAAVTVPHDQR